MPARECESLLTGIYSQAESKGKAGRRPWTQPGMATSGAGRLTATHKSE